MSEAARSEQPKIFISYSRRNLGEVSRLRDDLIAVGFAAYLDLHDIAPGEPWRERLGKLIGAADTVVFALSPTSITSTVVDWEVNEAERLQKRIIPVVIADVANDLVPGRIIRLNFVFMRNDGEWSAGLSRLADALRIDIEWIRQHTRLAELSAAWESAGRRADLLLHGESIAAAESWAVRRPADVPSLTGPIASFIETSRTVADAAQARELVRQKREVFRNRIIAWGSLAATVVLSMLGWQLLSSFRDTLRSESLFLADLAMQKTRAGDGTTGMLLALEALSDPTTPDWRQRVRPYVPRAEFALGEALRHTREHRVLIGHSSPVQSAAASPDGRHLLTADGDGHAILWDARTGTELRRVRGTIAELSADGRFLATIDDGRVCIWEAETGSQVRCLTDEKRKFSRASFSPDGRHVVVAALHHEAVVWSWMASRVRTALPHSERNWVHSAAYSRSGTYIVTLSGEPTSSDNRGLVRIWNAVSTGLVFEFPVHHAHSALPSPDGSRILTAGFDRTARIWDAASGAEIHRLEGHTGQVYRAEFSPDGKLAVTASLDNSARIWETATGKLVAVLEGHQYWVMQAAFTADGRQILTAGADSTVRLWDVAARGLNIIEIRDISLAATQNGAAFDTTGEKILAVGPEWGDLRVWNAETGRPEANRPCKTCTHIARGIWKGRSVPTLALAYEGVLHDAETGERSGKLDQETYLPHASAYDARTETLTLAIGGGEAGRWDVRTGRRISRFRHCPASSSLPASCHISSIDVARNSDHVLTGAADRTARIWNASTGVEMQRLNLPSEVVAVAFSPDDKKIAVAASFQVHVFEADTGKLLIEFKDHTNEVKSVEFSADGSRVLSAGLDGTVRIWDARSGVELHRMEMLDAILTATFAADGERVLTTSLGRVIRLLRFEPVTSRLISAARQKAARCLTPLQRLQFHLPAAIPHACYTPRRWPFIDLTPKVWRTPEPTAASWPDHVIAVWDWIASRFTVGPRPPPAIEPFAEAWGGFHVAARRTEASSTSCVGRTPRFQHISRMHSSRANQRGTSSLDTAIPTQQVQILRSTLLAEKCNQLT